MAEAKIGVIGQAQLNAGMGGYSGGDDKVNALQWSVIWFASAVAFILFIYFGFGGLRGQVAS